MNRRREITRSLQASAAGLEEGLDSLVPRLYDELRRLAAALLRREAVGHTLQPTALANEAWLRLANAEGVQPRGRAHFLGLAARVMRRVLIDHARRRSALKRGGARRRVTLHDVGGDARRPGVDVLALDDALDALAALDDRKARVVEFRFFAGMAMREVAEALGVSQTTAEDDWHFARAWLARRMGG